MTTIQNKTTDANLTAALVMAQLTDQFAAATLADLGALKAAVYQVAMSLGRYRTMPGHDAITVGIMRDGDRGQVSWSFCDGSRIYGSPGDVWLVKDPA